MKKICSINGGEFEFPFDYFGEASNIGRAFTQYEDYATILNITTELNTEEDLAAVNGDYMTYMLPISNININTIAILHVEESGDMQKITPVVTFNNYNTILDLGTDYPPMENLYRGTIRFGNKV